MKNIAKRAAALLCVVMILSSILMVPASAANASFYNKGPIETKKKSIAFSFSGYGIDYAKCVRYDANAPKVDSFNVEWAAPGKTCTGTLELSGGKRGTYQYDIGLYSDSSGMLATLWVFVTV